MKIIEIILGVIFAIITAGGVLFKYKKGRSNKSSMKNIKINGDGKVVAGDDNSINIDK